MIVPPCPRCHLFHPATAPCPDLARPASEDTILPAGAVLAGRYRVLAVVQRGGMSLVYRAEDSRVPARRVALKELRVAAEVATSREAEAWFARESYMLSTLQHPLIPAFYGAFHEGGHSYIAQEFIEGENLEALVRRQGPVEETRVLRWGVELCGVLTVLHEHATGTLVYCDLKPANVIVRASDGQPVLVDFGSTRTLAAGEVGTVIGTPGYAAPEQYQGLAGPRTDVYALGATLHRLVTGHDPERAPPFQFPSACELNPAVSPALAAVLARAVQLDPAARYATAGELRRALVALAAHPVTPSGSSCIPAVAKIAPALLGPANLAFMEVLRSFAGGLSDALYAAVSAIYFTVVLAIVIWIVRRYGRH
jgi:serine/threonine-protein kinase